MEQVPCTSYGVGVDMPQNIEMRLYIDDFFNDVQQLCQEEARAAWKNSQIAIVMLKKDEVIGALRGLTDENITTYISEILIRKDMRGKGLGKFLLEACHLLYPRTRIDLMSSESADDFYRSNSFREINGFRKSYV